MSINKELELMINVLKNSGLEKMIPKLKQLNVSEDADFDTVYLKVKEVLNGDRTVCARIVTERFRYSKEFPKMIKKYA
jgi:hypothetical protein